MTTTNIETNYTTEKKELTREQFYNRLGLVLGGILVSNLLILLLIGIYAT